MRRLREIMLSALLLVPGIGACEAVDPSADPNELRTYVDGVVTDAMHRDAIAGVSVSIVNRSGLLFSKGYGVAGLNPQRAMDSDTLCRVGSISKTLVWIALMQLAERGKLALDDPINQHLPSALQIPDEGFSEPIRIRHLMTHAAGFEETILGHMIVDDVQQELPLLTYLARYRPHRIRAPGELAVYSNYGAALAGAIVAQVSGMSWENYSETRIMRPLGMLTSTYREAIPPDIARLHGLPQPAPAEVAAKMGAGFRWREDHLEEGLPEYITHYAPAGALSASGNDMARYMLALLDTDGLVRAGVLSAQSVHVMLEPSFANAKGFGTIHHGFFQFLVPGSSSAFGHDGDTRYRHSIMMIEPDAGIGIFVSVNTPSGLHLVERLPYLIGLHLQGVNAPTTAVAVTAAQDVPASSALTGTYRSVRRAYWRTERAFLNLFTSSVEATDNGDLLVSGISGETLRYRPLGQNVYQEITGLQRIAFRQSAGKLLLLDSSGSEPQERISFWQGSGWLLTIVALTHSVALWGSIQLLRRGRSALRFLSLTWLVAFVLTWFAMIPWLSDTDTLITRYPGSLFPAACWLLFIAALGTAVVIAGMAAIRPRAWSTWRWVETSTALLIFSACAFTLRYWGLLGFSGW